MEVNPSKLGGAIPDEATLDGRNLAAEAAKRAMYRVNHVGTKLNEGEPRVFEALAAKRNQTQSELIRGLIRASQLAYRSPHHKMKSEV
jgi:hypothetical protein